MLKPRIYTVLTFRKLEDQTRVCCKHMIAAFTSKEAEEAIKAADEDVLDGCDVFINTDAICDQRDHQVMLFVSGSETKVEHRNRSTEAEFQGWARVVTVDNWQDGYLDPAPFRRVEREAVPA
jgi:hypothetical protein